MRRVDEALALNRETGYLSYQPLFVAHLGWIHRSRGDYGRALRFGRDAARLAEETGHAWWMAFAEAMLGWTLTDLFALDEAVAHLERGLEAAARDGAESYLVRCLSQLALARWLRGDRGQAFEALERAEAIIGAIGAPKGSAFLHGGHAYLAAARVRLSTGEPDRAQELLRPLLEAAEVFGWCEVESEAALVMGRCALMMGSASGAEPLLSRSISLAESKPLAQR